VFSRVPMPFRPQTKEKKDKNPNFARNPNATTKTLHKKTLSKSHKKAYFAPSSRIWNELGTFLTLFPFSPRRPQTPLWCFERPAVFSSSQNTQKCAPKNDHEK